jgi:hypothetical protein
MHYPVRAQAWSKAMQSTHSAKISTNQVMALYADRALSFNLAKDATFADLADRLDHASDWHTDMPTAVYLKFGLPRQPIRVAQPGF